MRSLRATRAKISKKAIAEARHERDWNCAFFADSRQSLAVVLGTNEIASAVAVKLRKAHFNVVLSHDPYPPVIRRGMAFYDALFDDEFALHEITGQRAETALEIAPAARENCVAVTPCIFATCSPCGASPC